MVLGGLVWPSAEKQTPAFVKPAPIAAPASDDPRVVDFTTVEINPDAIAALSDGANELELPLASGERLILQLQPPEPTDLGGHIHRGTVKGKPESTAMLINEDDRWAGTIDLPDGRYFTLLHAGDGKYRLEQIDLSRDPICETDEDDEPQWTEDGDAVMARDSRSRTGMSRAPLRSIPQPVRPVRYQFIWRVNLRSLPQQWFGNVRQPSWMIRQRPVRPTAPVSLVNPGVRPAPTRTTGLNPASRLPSSVYGAGTANVAPVSTPSGGGGIVVDLMIVYCTGVESKYGGAAGLKSAAQLAVQMANTAYARSGVQMTLNLVHVAPVQYLSSGNLGGDLHNLTFKHAGLRKHVGDLRERYRADLVTLVSSANGGGVGWLLMNKKGSKRTGFNVLGSGSLRGYTLAHEVGHNLGCQHARGDRGASKRGLFAHGYGHRFRASNGQGASRQYRTIMAYAPGRRIGRFSNPASKFQGVATGISQANNAAVLNHTVKVVSGYR